VKEQSTDECNEKRAQYVKPIACIAQEHVQFLLLPDTSKVTKFGVFIVDNGAAESDARQRLSA
jgi:hypothetical protein